MREPKTDENIKQLADEKAIPERDAAWYARRRCELQQQKVKLLGARVLKPRVRLKLKKSA